jgi:hypothetical protein
MSGTNITVAAPPTIADVAAATLAYMAAQSGVVTDFNVGSQIRTEAEAKGSVIEMQGIIAQALAFQAAIYGAFSLFGIVPLTAQQAVGTIFIYTGAGASPPPATQAVLIPQGTLISTVAGLQFQTTQVATLAVGATGVSIPAECVTAGTIGNITASAVTNILSSLSYGPLLVTNLAPFSGGINAESVQQTLARFTAKVTSIVGASPAALANSLIGIQASGSAEKVAYATCYEPWVIQQQLSEPVTPGYVMIVDNGTGTASSSLLQTVSGILNPTPSAPLRPAGVPYQVQAVNPTDGSVVITGSAISTSFDDTLDALAFAAVQSYQASLNFGDVAELSQLNAVVANSTVGLTTSLTVGLFNVSGGAVSTLTPPATGRVVFTTITTDFS